MICVIDFGRHAPMAQLVPVSGRALAIFFLPIILFSVVGRASAQQDPALKITSQANGYTIHHVVFNSTFVSPEVAKIYGIKRSKYESMLNVSVNYEGEIGGIPATISGTVSNLMQQQKNLKFKHIREDQVSYYLAPVRVANEELLRFRLLITPEGSDETFEISFQQTVYADE